MSIGMPRRLYPQSVPLTKTKESGFAVANRSDQRARPGLPLRHGHAIQAGRVRCPVLSVERIRVVGKSIMRLIEDVVQHSRLAAVTGGEQTPQFNGLNVRQRSDKVAVPTVGTVRIQPLQVQQSVGAESGSPTGSLDPAHCDMHPLTNCPARAAPSPG